MKISRELGLLKFKLFYYGVNINTENLKRLSLENYRVPSFVRTGASYGIEAIVEDKLCVNIPINLLSPICISNDFKSLKINDEFLCGISVLKNPISLDLKVQKGYIKDVAKVCFDRLGLTTYTGCRFKENKKGCNFCGISLGSNYSDKYLLTTEEVDKLVRKSLSIPNNGIKHILLSGGVLPGDDYGAVMFGKYAEMIKSRYPDLSIYVMMPPPKLNSSLQYLIDSGVDEIALNIEIMNDNMRKTIISGKEEIGMKRYFNALEYLAERLPKYATRSILMGGIEEINYTLHGIEELCKRGVLPIISYYRTFSKTVPNIFQSEKDIYNLWESAVEIANRNNMIIGPTCIPCQNNVIALPVGMDYKYY